MNRLYVAEPVPSTVSTVADHLLRVRAGDVVFLLGGWCVRWAGAPTGWRPHPTAWTRSACALGSTPRPRGPACPSREGVVMVGETQPPAAHALAWEANRLIGAGGARWCCRSRRSSAPRTSRGGSPG